MQNYKSKRGKYAAEELFFPSPPTRSCYKGREHQQTGFSLLNSDWKKIQLDIVFSTVLEMCSLASQCHTFLFKELIDILASDAEI